MSDDVECEMGWKLEDGVVGGVELSDGASVDLLHNSWNWEVDVSATTCFLHFGQRSYLSGICLRIGGRAFMLGGMTGSRATGVSCLGVGMRGKCCG